MKRTSSAATSSRVGSRVVAVDDLAERPGVALRAAADHDRLGARRREHHLRAGARRHVAGRDDRDVDERDELRGQRVIRRARVHLLRRARMERQRRCARLDQPRPELEARARAVLAPRGAASRSPAGRLRSRPPRRCRQARSASSSRCAPAPVRVTFLTGQPKLRSTMSAPTASTIRAASAIEPRLGAEELDRERVLVGGDAQVAEGALVAVLDPGAADHLGAHEPRAVAPALAPERLHADARHRREHEARRAPRRRRSTRASGGRSTARAMVLARPVDGPRAAAATIPSRCRGRRGPARLVSGGRL